VVSTSHEASEDNFAEFTSTGKVINPVRKRKQSMIRAHRKALKEQRAMEEFISSYKGESSKPTNGRILGRRRDELPDVAVSNKVRRLRPGQVYLTIRKEIFDILSKKYPTDKLTMVGLTAYGNAYLALNYLLLQVLKAMNNQVLDIKVARIHVWMLLHACLPTDRHDERGCYSYRIDRDALVNGSGGLFQTKAPVYAGGQTLAWPTGVLIDGQNELISEASVPPLSNDDIVRFGEQAWTDMMNFMAGKGFAVVPEPEVGGEHDHYRSSVGIFALTKTTGGYSVLDRENNPSLWGSTLGLGVDAAIEVELHSYEEWLARLGWCEQEDDESPVVRYVGFNGLLDFGNILYNELQGRQPGNWEAVPVFYPLAGFVNQIMFQVVQADTNLQLDGTGPNPFSDAVPMDTYEQKGKSAIRSVSPEDFLHGLILAIMNVVSQTAYVGCDVFPNNWDLPVGTGTSQVGDFSSLEVSFPTQLVETIRSTLPVGRVESEVIILKNEKGEEYEVNKNTAYYPVFYQGEIMDLNVINGPDSTLENYLKALYPQIVNVDYNWGPQLTALPPVWVGGFDPTRQYFGSEDYVIAVKSTQTFLSRMKPYILMQVVSSGENDAYNTLLYYHFFGEAEAPEQLGDKVYFTCDILSIVNRDSINRKHTGWDFSHVPSLFIPQPNATPERAIDLGWLQNYYGATYRLQNPEKLSSIEHDIQACLNYVKERGGQGNGELGGIDEAVIAQGLGGGQSTFTNILGKLVPAGINAAAKALSGDYLGAIGSGLSVLPKFFTKERILKSKEREPYSNVPYQIRHYVKFVRKPEE
jgi:hypothetical protein